MTENRESPLDLSQALVALDSAVAAACEELLPPEECADRSVAVRLENGLRGLRGLASGESPDWRSRETAVLYSSWYQLGHVNLAYNVALALVENWAERLPGQKTLHVVDFGAGTLALPVAFELLRSRKKLSGNVVLHLIESSEVMLKHGQRIFANLRSGLVTETSTTALKVIGPGTVPVDESAFCLMHAVYSDNEDLKHSLSSFVSRCRPFYGVATCYCKKLDLLMDLEGHCLSQGFECTDVPLKPIPHIRRTPLRKTQQYRAKLYKSGMNHFNDPGRVETLLTRDVPLWPWDPAIREYAPRN